MVLKRPFGLKELFKPMIVWLASLIFEMRTFAKKPHHNHKFFCELFPKVMVGHFKDFFSDSFVEAHKLVRLRYKL